MGHSLDRKTTIIVTGIVMAWALAVSVSASLGFLDDIPGVGVAALVATGVLLPTFAYFGIRRFRKLILAVGIRALTMLHAWRIAAAGMFFLYGAQGELPARFVAHAGWGDLIAGTAAVVVVVLPFSRGRYLAVHAFGFADFVLAVGTGLYFTLVEPVAMDAIRTLPLALIPLFGVGISGATHIMAFDMLIRGRGLPAQATLTP